MSRGMVSFLAGMGTGYIKARDKAYEQERQAKQDAWMEEQRTRQRQEWQDADKLKTDIKDATAERQTVQGTETTAGGTRMFSATPENAASMAALMANEAELTGAAPVQMPTTAVTGNMARGHQIGATAGGMNKPDARNQRVVDALMNNGQIERAATMQNNALEQQAKQIGIDAATFKLLNDKYNMKISELLSGPDWVKGVEGILAETKLGGLDGITPTARATKDGNSIEFFYEKDGKQVVLATLPSGEKGRLAALQAFSRMSPEVQVGWLTEQEKAKQAQVNADRAHELDKQKTTALANYYQASAGAKEKTATSAYERMDEIDRKTFDGLQKQIDTIDKAILDAKIGGMADPAAIKEHEARLGAYRIQQRQLAAKYQTATQAPDPQGLRSPTPARSTPTGPTNTSERQMARDVQGGMGADPDAIRRELAASKANLTQVQDDASRKMLTDYIASLEQQLARVGGAQPAPAKPAPAAPVTRVQAAAAPKPAAPTAPTKSMGEYLSGMFSGSSDSQINGIKNKLARGLPLSGTETVIARENKLIATR